MSIRLIGLSLAAAGIATAQDPATADSIRELLNDPNSDVAKLAKQYAGKSGGNQLFYFPTRDEPATPRMWGLKYESVDFKSADGTALHGWFIPAKSKTPQTAKGTVVFSHGNTGSVGHHLGFCVWLAEAGYNVLLYDYRGFGKSGGSVDRRGMIDDVKAAFAYVRKRPDIDPEKLISYGHSLGGAQSVTALGESPVKGLRAIVIDGAFASYQAMARIIGGQLGASLVTDELSPRDFVKKLTPTPLLVVHGTRDEIVPVSQGKQLYEAAGEPKTLFEVKAGRHGTALSNDNGAYRKKMIEWLDGVMKG
ncbi:alpha/beta fold hydrolase [Luteolibacter yonseiensis]|uniref:Alpha/beta fold hydrolase n=1 Tax=Luteolibacter yonseiensis TaxID=1144680 RepID=A0A934R131_9BACT|nr:alpha/beta fold hydrolase [Luteolibacter yonseiensis]MBK1814797.1 alpha/beta fold hydrolase [Luteolibacter yonseiensis]